MEMNTFKSDFLCEKLQGRIEFAPDCLDSKTDSGSVFSILADGDAVFSSETPENEGFEGINNISGLI